MQYIDALKRGMGYSDEDLDNAVLDIRTAEEEYPLSFIRFETDTLLAIDWTRSDGTEGFVVLNKKYITSIAIVYRGDISIEKVEEDEYNKMMYN